MGARGGPPCAHADQYSAVGQHRSDGASQVPFLDSSGWAERAGEGVIDLSFERVLTEANEQDLAVWKQSRRGFREGHSETPRRTEYSGLGVVDLRPGKWEDVVPARQSELCRSEAVPCARRAA